MEDRKESGGSRKRPLVVGVLALLVLGTALALVSASSGSTSKPQTAAAKPVVVISTGKGFGEVYAAKTIHARAHALQGQAHPEARDGAQHRAGRARPSRQEGQRGAGAQVLEEQRLQDRDERQAQGRVHRAVRRERLPPDVEDGVHPPGADVSRRSARSSTRALTVTSPRRSPTGRRRSPRVST